MFTVLAIVHIIVSLCLCIVVLMQSSKGGGLSGAFGGGGGLPQQMFGSKAMTTALHKATIYLAVAFFLTSALLFMLTADRTSNSSVMQDAAKSGTVTTPVTQTAEPIESNVDTDDSSK
jgi:preprotein translocase subunit SecG